MKNLNQFRPMILEKFGKRYKMGANSSTVVVNGEWNHQHCWTETNRRKMDTVQKAIEENAILQARQKEIFECNRKNDNVSSNLATVIHHSEVTTTSIQRPASRPTASMKLKMPKISKRWRQSGSNDQLLEMSELDGTRSRRSTNE